MGRKSRLFAYSISSPGSRVAVLGVEIAESLQPCPRIFPFCGDYRRRQVRSRLPPNLIKRSNPARSASFAAAAYSLREAVGNKRGISSHFCWYPTARIFGQPKLGDWDSVMTEVGHELAKEIAKRNAPATNAICSKSFSSSLTPRAFGPCEFAGVRR
jgi:hypothetical protein